jgi:hypothetical protein
MDWCPVHRDGASSRQAQPVSPPVKTSLRASQASASPSCPPRHPSPVSVPRVTASLSCPRLAGLRSWSVSASPISVPRRFPGVRRTGLGVVLASAPRRVVRFAGLGVAELSASTGFSAVRVADLSASPTYGFRALASQVCYFTRGRVPAAPSCQLGQDIIKE